MAQLEISGKVQTGKVHLEDVSVGMELGKYHLICSLPCSPVLTLGGLRPALNLEKVELAMTFLLCNQDYKHQQLKIKARLSSVLGMAAGTFAYTL